MAIKTIRMAIKRSQVASKTTRLDDKISQVATKTIHLTNKIGLKGGLKGLNGY